MTARPSRALLPVLLSLATILPAAASAPSAGNPLPAPRDELWYGIEVGGQLAGWEHVRTLAGEPRVTLDETLLRLTVIGQPFDVRVASRDERDPASGAPLRLEVEFRRGDDTQQVRISFAGETARLLGEDGRPARTLSLDGAWVEQPASMARVLAALPREGATLEHRVLFPPRFELHRKRWTRGPRETIEVRGERREAIRIDAVDEDLGVSAKTWVDPATGLVLRTETSTGLVSYLADPGIRDRIAAADFDRMIFAEVGVDIPNHTELSRMKVRAKLRTAGERVTAESLNVPGQRFTGTVTDNLVHGVFEIAWPRYDGKDAPPFPWKEARSLVPARYLEPEEMIEADDPAISARARELTRGATDAWDATKRLARFVAEEISWEIPGGSARHTLDTRRGECGAHSRLLVALCRAAGIPARVVSGAVYNPLHGGSFGQHAWVEVFLGEGPGWIPLDPTMHEIDRCDAGHLRLGERATFNPVEMEILDWVAGDRRAGQAPPALAAGRIRVPWEAGRPYRFSYHVRGRPEPLGTETLVVERVDPDGTVHGRTTLAIGPATGESTWTIAPDGRPLAFSGKGRAGTLTLSVDCAFEWTGEGGDGKVRETLARGEQRTGQDLELPAGTWILPNNNFGLLSFLLASAPEGNESPRSVSLFSPDIARVLAGDLRPGPRETIDWHGRQVATRRVTLVLAGIEITGWLDEEGRLLRCSQQQGAVVAELEEDAAP